MLMSQVARTAGWDKATTSFAFTSAILLFLNIFVQAFLLKMMAKEENIMDAYAGQMYLCNFGAKGADCPGPGCIGPYGTEITGPRLYDWTSISIRTFVKQTLMTVLPEKAAEIDAAVDPGEYGVESHECRILCCIVFMISCMGELVSIYKIALLLYKIPTADEPWMVPKESESDAPKMGNMEEIEVKIAGMPLIWKVINMVCIVLPKIVLWKLTAETGIEVLMETSNITDAITNSVGLTFILSIDELVGEALLEEEIQEFLDLCQDFPLYDTEKVKELSTLTDDEILQKYQETQRGCRAWSVWDVLELFPRRLFEALMGTALFVFLYYNTHCIANDEDEGNLVSKPIHTPVSMSFSWLNALLPNVFPPEQGTFSWEMPHGGLGNANANTSEL